LALAFAIAFAAVVGSALKKRCEARAAARIVAGDPFPAERIERLSYGGDSLPGTFGANALPALLEMKTALEEHPLAAVYD